MKKLIPLLVIVMFALLAGSFGCGSEAEQHYKRGLSHGNRGNIDIAIEEYTKAIELNPQYAEAYYRRGHDYETLAGWTTAGSPNYAPRWNTRFNAVECRNQAISDLSRAIELRPDYWEAYYHRGAAYYGKGEYDASIADFGKVIELEYKGLPPPYDLGVYDGRGKAYLRKGEYDSAISDFSKIIELIPKASAAYANRGIAYMRKGEYNSALADLTKGIESHFDPSDKFKYLWYQDADWYLYRGQIYQAMGLKNEALADFQKVLELAKNPEWIQAAKQGIEELRTTQAPTQPPALTPTPGSTLTPTPTLTPPPTITAIPKSPSTPSITPFSFRGVLFGLPSSLGVSLQIIDQISGKVIVNGSDSRRPAIPFTFNWGDGKTTDAFFPVTYTYSDTNRNYLITVTAHYDNRTTDSKEMAVRFVAPVVKPVSMPDDVRVTIPMSPVSLVSRMPGYAASSRLTVFDDSHFGTTPRSTVEYVLTVAASIQKDFANDDVYLVDGGFRQVVLRDPEFSGMYSLWFTSPVSFGAATSALRGTVQYSSFMHEMGHNVTLNSPSNYYYGDKMSGNANAIFSETMAQIFQHATAYQLLNDYQTYGLSEDLATDIRESALASMRVVKDSYESYLSGGKRFASWNKPQTPHDETFYTFMTIAYKFVEYAEKGSEYRIPLKRMMALLQTFDEDMRTRYDQYNNTEAAATFRSTLMITALSYAFETDLRPEFRALNFPIGDQVYDELYYKASSRPR